MIYLLYSQYYHTFARPFVLKSKQYFISEGARLLCCLSVLHVCSYEHVHVCVL